MYHALEDDVNLGAGSHSGAKDFLFDGRQTGTLFAAMIPVSVLPM
jgi:hypothetical protein